MKKKVFLLLLSCLVILTMAGCQKKQEETQDSISIDMSETLYQIAKEAKFETTFEVEEDYLTQKYEWDSSKGIEVVGLFGSMLDTNRALLFQVETKEEKQVVLDYLVLLQEKLTATYLDEMTEEKAQIQQAKILNQGHYILFVSGINAQDAAHSFDQVFATNK